jgi:hypothetical protein
LPSIEWAAYANDTIRFEKSNLNKILANRLAKKEIKVSLPIYSGIPEANHINFSSKSLIDERSTYRTIATASAQDTMNIRYSIIKTEIDFDSPTITDLTQIIYIENKTLKSYIPWVSPRVIPITTSAGISLGMNDYFSSCFNFKYNYQPGQQNKISFLSQTKKIIRLDTIEIENKLKELYGRNLVETLWPYILQGNIKAYSFEKNKELNPKETRDTLVNTARLPVPLYDSIGNISSYIIPSENLSSKVFTAIELVQGWYYDHTKNIVFNKIKEARLYAKKWVGDVQDKEASPILKIVFN